MKTAARKDINDEETAIFCARKIVDIERLKMLYLLTVADSMATGPAVWNDWTSALLQSLFLRVLHIMEGGELATHKAVELVEKKKEEILSSASTIKDRNEMKEIFSYMSPRYILYTTAQDILRHIRLYRSLGSEPFVWEVTGNTDLDIRTVTICATDRPGLFSKIAGTFTLNGMDILESQIYTWRNNIALDIFKVKPPLDRIREDEWWARAKQDLRSAISGMLDLSAALGKRMLDYGSKKPRLSERPNQVIIDNNSSSFFTIIEVFTYDFPGLLYMVTDALFRCGLDVRVAKIATKVDQVVDVFYVRDFDGQKADAPDQVDKIKAAIIAVLPASVPGSG
jgi:[protein-PII] uridylyltransferase